MSWNNGFEKRKFEREWAKNEALYRKEGMTDEQIAEIRKFDEEIYNSNRRFTEHTQDFPTSDFDEGTADEAESTLLKDFADELSVTVEDCLFKGNRFAWIEDISDAELATRLKSLSEDDIELLTKSVFDGLTQTEMALEYGIAQKNISKKLKRIKIFLSSGV